jgi:predicted MFS family arabinose efflux permease
MVADLLALLDPAGSANPGGSASPANPAGPANPVGVVALVLGAALVGIGFGLVQNDSLVSMFALSGPARYSTASAVWNAAYDTGTGIGAVGLGALAQGFGFRVAFGAVALLLLAGLPALASGAVRKVN